MSDTIEQWYKAPKHAAHAEVFAYVRRIETEQSDTLDRISLLEALYDPYSPTGSGPNSGRPQNVTENVVASNVDTTYASVGTSEVRARYLTDGADWSAQRRAKKLEYYTDGIGKAFKVHQLSRLGLKEAAKKGVGLNKVYRSRWDTLEVESARIADIIVADADSRPGAPPLQLHHVQRAYDRERLKAEYPEAAEDIDNMTGLGVTSTTSASSNPMLSRSKIAVVESIRLPIGLAPLEKPKGKSKVLSPSHKEVGKARARYVPGRRIIAIENRTLLDEEYNKPHYPFAVLTWSDREGSFYGISGAERIAGHQNALNRSNWQQDRIIDQSAMVTTFVRPSDSNVSVRSTKVGNVVTIKGDWPHTPVAPAVHPELTGRHARLLESAFNEFGQSRLAAASKIPAGLETGAAVREYRDQTTQRFTQQEAAFEQFVLDTYWLILDVCRDLGDKAPTVLESRWRKPIEWSEVDLGQVRIQISAASTLPRSPAGREQTVLEWAQAGVISADSAKRMIGHPDLEKELSLYTSALEVIDDQVERMLDGEDAIPEPLDNLELARWRVTQHFNLARLGRAPEEVLDALRDFIALVQYMINQAQPPANMNAAPAPVGPPAGQPTSALAPEAMNLRAG